MDSADFGKQTYKGGNPQLRGTVMRPEYDFSKGERGKFFRPTADLRFPVYLEAEVQTYFAARAEQQGLTLGEMVNMLLKQEIQSLESSK